MNNRDLIARYHSLMSLKKSADEKLVKVVSHPDTTPEMIAELRESLVPMHQQIEEKRKVIMEYLRGK